jgi:hypothetical protein
MPNNQALMLVALSKMCVIVVSPAVETDVKRKLDGLQRRPGVEVSPGKSDGLNTLVVRVNSDVSRFLVFLQERLQPTYELQLFVATEDGRRAATIYEWSSAIEH